MPISPYIASLRQHIGHELLLVPGVTTLIEDDDHGVLLVRHADFDGWSTVGGAVETDESPQQAALREALEELGVRIELTGIAGVVGGPEFKVMYRNGDQVAYVTTVFRAKITAGTVEPDNVEVTEARWFAQSELTEAGLTAFATATFRAVGML